MPLNRLNQDYQRNPRQLPLSIYIGFVKRNDDAQRMGRLSVFIPELGGDPDDPGSWVIVGYASPFAGATDVSKVQPGSQTMDGSQQAYGMWMVPPDLNNEVAVFFANSDMSRGYWFACCYQQNMNYMVPGIANAVTTLPVTPIGQGPVVEYNKSNVDSTANPRRPAFTPLTEGLAREGLTGDGERGWTTTSARREAPSQVYGFLTPRGNSIHVDDNTENEFIRMRTRSGAQVLIHETSGYVYINSKNGNSWLEISDAGIDVYTAESISMRSELDFNVRADRNINIDAGSSLNLRAANNITMSALNIEMEASSKINQTANFNIEMVTKGNILAVAGLDLHLTTGVDFIAQVANQASMTVGSTFAMVTASDFNIQSTAGDFTVLANNNLRLQSGLDMTQLSNGNLRLQSVKDTSQLAGGNQLRAGQTVFDTPDAVTGSGAPESTAAPVPSPDSPGQITPPVLAPGLILGDAKQSLVDTNTTKAVWRKGAGQVNTIVSRMPTHEPWHEHPNADVPPPPTTCVDVEAPPMVDAAVAGTVATSTDGTVPAGSTASNVRTDGTIVPVGCTAGVAGTKKISTEVYNAIMNACTKTGADPACMLAFADIESSFNPGISAKGSSATGLYQFVASTWAAMVAKYGARYNVGRSQINDAVGNALMGGQFICDNAAILKKAGIANPTPGQLYIVHFAGSGGGPKMILAAQKTPDQSASLLFPSAARANPTIFNGKSISQVVAHLSSLADTKAKAYAGQYGLPAPCDRGTAGAVATPMNPNQTNAAALTAPAPVDLHTQASGSVLTGGNGPPPVAPVVMNVPVGGSCQCDPISSGDVPAKANSSGFYGTTTQPASLLTATGLSNSTGWTKGSTDPSQWVVGQQIAIFSDSGQYTSNSHAAIFRGLIKEGNPRYTGKPGFLVYDQQPGQPAQERIVYYNQGGSNNASSYAAVNQPAPATTPNAAGASKVKQACVANYRANVGNCSGFVNAVGHMLGVSAGGGNADAIVQFLKGSMGGWTLLNGPAAALASAQAGNFVVAGLIGGQQATPNHHGHVVVVVDGPTQHGLPTAYWGSLGSKPGDGVFQSTLNYAWLAVDLPKVTYAQHALS